MRLVNSCKVFWQTSCDADPVSSFSMGRKLAADDTGEMKELLKTSLVEPARESGRELEGKAVICNSR